MPAFCKLFEGFVGLQGAGGVEREHLPQGGAVGGGVTGAQQRVGMVKHRRDTRIVTAPTAHEQGSEQQESN